MEITSAKPKISIITVVFNSEKYIERTLKSIACQSYTNIEYIVIDGNSQDNTLALVDKYSQLNPNIVSERDRGIYDAMNKGLKLATGDYVWFINSGDEIASCDTLEKIFSIPNAAKFDLIYGETDITNENGDVIGLRRLSTPKKLSKNSFKKGMLISHQSVLVKQELAPEFDLKYKYSSDYDWLLKVILSTDKYLNSNLILSKFMDGGQTKKTIVPGLKERFRIMTKQYGIFSTLFHHIPIGIKFLKYFIQNKRF